MTLGRKFNILFQLPLWQQFYGECFEFDYGIGHELRIPGADKSFRRLIYIPKGLRVEETVIAIRKKMPFDSCFRTHNHDLVVCDNDRTSKRSYALLVQDSSEPEELYLDSSAEQIRRFGIRGMTFLERLVLGLFRFWAYQRFGMGEGPHLDQACFTLCTGSRTSYGFIPFVGWNGEKLIVQSCSDSHANPHIGMREVAEAGWQLKPPSRDVIVRC